MDRLERLAQQVERVNPGRFRTPDHVSNEDILGIAMEYLRQATFSNAVTVYLVDDMTDEFTVVAASGIDNFDGKRIPIYGSLPYLSIKAGRPLISCAIIDMFSLQPAAFFMEGERNSAVSVPISVGCGLTATINFFRNAAHFDNDDVPMLERMARYAAPLISANRSSAEVANVCAVFISDRPDRSDATRTFEKKTVCDNTRKESDVSAAFELRQLMATLVE